MEYASRNKGFLGPVGFFILCTVGVLLWPNGGLTAALDPSGLAAARARWDAHHPAHYRMTLARPGCFSPRCTVDIEVQDEQIVKTVNHGCTWSPSRTVTELFEEVAGYQGQSYPAPQSSALVCNGISVIYDLQYGYPAWMGRGCPPAEGSAQRTHSDSYDRIFAVEDFTPLP